MNEDNIKNQTAMTNKTSLEKKSFFSSPAFLLFLASFISLFLELLFIRWVPSVIHVVGFFTNLVLLASFMGMSIGMFHADRRSNPENQIMLRLFILTILISIFIIFRIKAIIPNHEHNLNEISELKAPHMKVELFFILSGVYALILYAFIPVGELVGKYLKDFPPVKAYSINILGSLLGVLIFSALSYFGLPPYIWLLVGTFTVLPFSLKKRLHALMSILLVTIVATTYIYEEKSNLWKNFWTPYYNLKVFLNPPTPDGLPGGFCAFVNNFFLLSGVPIADNDEVYGLPYRYCKPEKILILGSGGGNDIAMALSRGVSCIDAVEIDPVVLDLGKYLNPQQVYSNPKVTAYLGDARNYLKNSRENYDLVIFGTLDSHGLFSALSNIKMENFVYTRESFEDVKRILSPEGIVATTVAFDQIWVPLRIYSTMAEVFGKNAIVHLGISSLVTVLAGPGMEGKQIQEMNQYKGLPIEVVQEIKAKNQEISIIPTDDWPHLFLKKKKLPLDYIKIMVAILLISCIPLFPSLRAAKNISSHFFFLGAGFLLLETKSITELALTFGSTWITNAVVISSILFVILLANLYVLRFKPQKYTLWYTLLLILLLLTYMIPHKSLLVGDPMLQVFISSLFCGLPIMFAAIIFAISFSQVSNSSEALAWNMLGCVIGGLCEYLSLLYGFRFLVLVAIGMYLLSIIDLFIRRGKIIYNQ